MGFLYLCNENLERAQDRVCFSPGKCFMLQHEQWHNCLQVGIKFYFVCSRLTITASSLLNSFSVQ